jgi:hypothetical protein
VDLGIAVHSNGFGMAQSENLKGHSRGRAPEKVRTDRARPNNHT